MNGTFAFNPDWNIEAEKYALVEITSGVVVMRSKLPAKGLAGCDGPVHYLCPDCFAQQRKCYLQREAVSDYRVCYSCRHEYFWGLPQAEERRAGA